MLQYGISDLWFSGIVSSYRHGSRIEGYRKVDSGQIEVGGCHEDEAEESLVTTSEVISGRCFF